MGNYISYIDSNPGVVGLGYILATPTDEIDFEGAFNSLFHGIQIVSDKPEGEFIFITDHAMPLVSPIAFIYDIAGKTWTWSPDMINFMSVDTEIVTGGEYESQTPHQTNVKIIQALRDNDNWFFSVENDTIFTSFVPLQNFWFMALLKPNKNTMLVPWSIYFEDGCKIHRRIESIDWPEPQKTTSWTAPTQTIKLCVDGFEKDIPWDFEDMHRCLVYEN